MLVAEIWTPECAEDELLVALVSVKRALLAAGGARDPGVFPVLHQLAAFGPSRQAPLADALSLDASTVSRHVRALVSDGLVEAARDPADGRATVLQITGAGQAYLREHLRAHRRTLGAATSGFTAGERAELVRLLHKLAGALGHVKESA